MHRSPAGFVLLAIILALHAPGAASAQPDTDRSLTADPSPAATTASPTAPGPGAGDNLSSLSREQLEARVRSLSQSLSLANTESEFFRRQWQDLRLRDEALGVEALTVDERKLEDKLVQAVKELYQSEMRRREALQLLDKLLASTEKLLQTAPHYDPKVRADYEVATRSAHDYLAGRSAGNIPLGISLGEGRIADVNLAANAVVLNLGKTQGVKEGMPFLISRDGVALGEVRVVLARDLVSAALIESVGPKVTFKVGDEAKVDARQ